MSSLESDPVDTVSELLAGFPLATIPTPKDIITAALYMPTPGEAVGGPQRNVSIAYYNGKPRGAVACNHGVWICCNAVCSGRMFLPLADGVFHARLEDTNDLAVIARDMATSVGAKGLFHSMSGSEFNTVLEANHISPSPGLAELQQGLQIEPVISDDPAWVFEPR